MLISRLENRLKLLEKTVTILAINISKNNDKLANNNCANAVILNKKDILEAEANMIEAVVDEFNAIVGEDE